jgi:DNA-binding HxlR family transcriptional regulator
MEDGTKNIPRNTSDTERALEVRQTLDMVGDKWPMLAMKLLYGHAMRFSELKREMTGVSQRMLSRSLRDLEREGLIDRTVYPSNPPAVEYAITEAGREFILAIIPLVQWARRDLDRAAAARERYDQRSTQ